MCSVKDQPASLVTRVHPACRAYEDHRVKKADAVVLVTMVNQVRTELTASRESRENPDQSEAAVLTAGEANPDRLDPRAKWDPQGHAGLRAKMVYQVSSEKPVLRVRQGSKDTAVIAVCQG